jgi:hypothetical protein
LLRNQRFGLRKDVMNFLDSIFHLTATFSSEHLPGIGAVIVIWAAGHWAIGLLAQSAGKGFIFASQRSGILFRYTASIVKVLFEVALMVGILAYFGLQTTVIAALLGGIGLLACKRAGAPAHFRAGRMALTHHVHRVFGLLQKLKESRLRNGLLTFTEDGPKCAFATKNSHPAHHPQHYWQLYFDSHHAVAEVFCTSGYPVSENL